MISVNVINLESSHERRAFMRLQLDSLGIAFRFFNAVDGRKMSAEALMEAAPRGGTDYCGLLTSGEMGCALSHLAVIREIAEGVHEYAAILEDDVLIGPEAQKFFDEKFLHSLPPFDILQLATTRSKPRLALDLGNSGGHQMCASPRCDFNMSGLIYTRETARSIAASITDITAPIDNMIFHVRRPFGLRVVDLWPPVVRPNRDLASDIGSRPRPKGLFTKLNRELRRVRNLTRLWGGFLHVYGLSGVLRLRLIQPSDFS
jgi:glycosyl transferase family 25